MKNLLLTFVCFIFFLSPVWSKEYQRIISIAPSLTENIYLLGEEHRLIANTIYCERPAEAKEKQKIGCLININLEKIINLNPDLVLATTLTPYQQLQRLKELGTNVIIFPTPKSFKEICKQFLELASLLNKYKEAKRIIKQITKQVNEIKKIKNKPKKKVFIQIDANPLWTACKNTFINGYIELAGGINIAGSIEKEYIPYNTEEVLKSLPDVIIIAEMGFLGVEEKKRWQKYDFLPAVKNDKIYIIDSSVLCIPTPESFLEALKEIRRLLSN